MKEGELLDRVAVAAAPNLGAFADAMLEQCDRAVGFDVAYRWWGGAASLRCEGGSSAIVAIRTRPSCCR